MFSSIVSVYSNIDDSRLTRFLSAVISSQSSGIKLNTVTGSNYDLAFWFLIRLRALHSYFWAFSLAFACPEMSPLSRSLLLSAINS